MIIDQDLVLSDNADVTMSCVSSVVDMGLGDGASLSLLCQVAEAFEGGSSVRVTFETSAEDDFSNPVTLLSTDAVPVDVLKQGYQFALSYVPFGALRYIRLAYDVEGAMTQGKINACVCSSLQSGK